jgi:hypothetical protein
MKRPVATHLPIVRCMRCRRRMRNNASNWNDVWIAGYVVGHLCPGCQSPDENFDAELDQIVRRAGMTEPPPTSTQEYIAALLRAYSTPEVMRSKADILSAARPDCRAGPVKLMRLIADDMESGALWEDQ